MPDKQLRIKVETDQASARQTKNILDGLTSSFEKLIGQANRLSATMANLGNGRSMQGASMGSATKGTSGVGSMGPGVRTIGPGRGGLLGSLLGAGSGSEINSLGTSTVSALGSVETKVKSFVSSAVQELSRLQAAISGVTGHFEDLAGSAPNSGAVWKNGAWRSGGGGGRAAAPPIAGPPASDEGGGGPGPSTGGGGGSSGGGGRSRGGGGKERSDGTKPFRMNPLSQYGLMGGITAGFLPALGPLFSAANLGEAGLGLAARYGFGKGEQLNDWMVSERMARIGMTLNRPGETLSRKTEIASPFGMMTQAVLGKSYSTRIGYVSALHDPAFLESFGNKILQEEAANIRAYGEGTAKGTMALLTNEGRNAMGNKGVVASLLNSTHQNSGSFLGDAVGAIGAQVGAVTELVSRAASPNPNGPTAGTTKETKFDIALREELAKIDPHNADILRQAIQGKTEMQGPLFNHMVDEIYGNALGRTAAYRGLGLSGGTVKDKDGNYKTALEAHRAKLLARGWDIPNEESARQAILSIGTGFNQVYGQSSNALMGMGMSGLGNLPQLMKLGGMLTGSLSGSKGFIDNVLQASIGTGGLDVAPGRELVQSLAEMALKSGQFGIGNAAGDMIKHYAGLVHGYQGYEFDTAEQHRRSMNIQLGLAEFGQYTSGKAAPMYDVMRQVSAIQATGGKWSYMADVLSNLPPALQKSISEGGTIPLEYQGYLKPEQIAKHLGVMENAPFAELMGQFVPKFTGVGLNYEQAQRDYRLAKSRGGGVKEAIERHMMEFSQTHPGIDKKGMADEELRQLRTFGGLYGMAHGTSWDRGEGMVEGFLGKEFFKGRGVGVGGPKEGEAAALVDQAAIEDAKARAGAPAGVAVQQGKGGQGADILNADEHAYDYIRTGGAGLPGAFGNLRNAIDIVVRALPPEGPINYGAQKTTGPKGSSGKGTPTTSDPVGSGGKVYNRITHSWQNG